MKIKQKFDAGYKNGINDIKNPKLVRIKLSKSNQKTIYEK